MVKQNLEVVEGFLGFLQTAKLVDTMAQAILIFIPKITYPALEATLIAARRGSRGPIAGA